MSEIETDNMLFATPAACSVRATTEQLLEIARSRRALSADVFDRHPPFFWSAEISSGRLDAYYTRMAVSTLKNYAADAEAGVAFQNSHRTRELSLGRSLTGQFVGAQGNGIASVVADFYTVAGLQLGEVPTDQIIVGIETGILSDVSVGFYGGRFVCSICGRDMLRDRDCWHIPGWEEEVEGDGTVRKVIAEATVEDAHLAEVSVVYDGATPGASILKAQAEAESGRIRPEAKRFIEQRYRINLPDKRVVVPGHSNGERSMSQRRDNQPADPPASQDPPATPPANPPADPPVQDPPANPPAADPAPVVDPPADPPPAVDPPADAGEPIPEVELTRQLPQVRTLLVAAGVPDRGDLMTRVRALVERASDGAAYREALITEALGEGVRAFGAGFNQEAYRRTLEASSLDVVRLMRDDWKRAAKNTFPGSRLTTEEDGHGTAAVTDEPVNDSAFAGA